VIGTTYLRSKMLPAPYPAQAADLLRQYVANRLEFYNAGIDDVRLQAANDQAGKLQGQLWAVVTAAIVGYNSGLSNRRHLLAALTLIVLIAVIIWVLIDLDRPRRSLILISQQNMIDLQQALNRDVP